MSKLVFGRILLKKVKILEYFEKNYIFVILAYELPNRFFFSKKSDNFFFWILTIFWTLVHDSQWQVHLRRSNIYSKFCYMFLTHKKHYKNPFLGNFRIFRNSWLFSEIFGYFLTHRYQIWLFWHKIRNLQIILDCTDILNKYLEELGIKNAIIVL